LTAIGRDLNAVVLRARPEAFQFRLKRMNCRSSCFEVGRAGLGVLRAENRCQLPEATNLPFVHILAFTSYPGIDQ
jgi:hypothetical protein